MKMIKVNKNTKILILILGLICTIVVPISFSKYYQDSQGQIVTKSTPFYFDTTASNLTILYSDDSSFNFDVLNYKGNLITEEDIKYTISWENDTYGLIINDEEFNQVSSNYSSSLKGNVKSFDNINISFIAPEKKPVKEEMKLKICATEPYSLCEEYLITIISPDGFQVIGNPTEWTKDDVVLEVVPKEGNNQIEYCSFDNGLTWENASVSRSIAPVCSKTFSENQLVKIKTKYFDGTESDEVDVEITKIDKEAPTVEFDYIDDNKDQTLIVTLGKNEELLKNLSYDDDKSGFKEIYILYNGEVVTNSSIFTKVGRYTVTYKAIDNLGNEKDYLREVLVRWDVGGKYIVQRQNAEVSAGNKDNCMGVKGIGLANNADLMGLWQDTADTGLDESLPFASKYYFSGKTVCNNIVISDKTFNVMNIAVNDSIKIIGTVSSKNVKWGSRKIYDSDIYSAWQEWASSKRIYYSNDAQATQLTDAEFSHLIQGTFYPGRFVRNSDQTFSELIGKERYANGHLGGNNASNFSSYFAFPNVSDYLRASNRLDIIYNIRKIQTNQSTYVATSWLSQSDEQWTINTKNDTSTDNDYWVLAYGDEIISRTYYYAQNYRPVFYLNSDTILSGTGDSSDPFKIEENWDWFDSQYPTSLYK